MSGQKERPAVSAAGLSTPLGSEYYEHSIPDESAHAREVIGVHEGYGVEAICSACYTYWPCAAAKEEAPK